MICDAFSYHLDGLLTSDLQVDLILLEICVHNISIGI
jgi:hypothetical protein